MKHVVFLSPHSDPEARLGEVDAGGQCVYEYELAKMLSTHFDTRVTIYCRKKFDYPKLSEVNPNFAIKRVVCGGEEFIPKEKLAPHLDEFAQKVAHDLKAEGVDIIHGHYWDGGKAAILVHKYLFRDVPIVWTPHSLGGIKRKNFKGMTEEMEYNFVPRVAWESYSMLAANAIVVSTSIERDQIINEYGIEEKKIHVLPPGIPTSNFKRVTKFDARKKLGLPDDRAIVMTMGRLDRRKGYHNAIRTMAEFNRLFNFPASLVIMAGNENTMTNEEKIYREELKMLAHDAGLNGSFIWKDAVDFKDVRYAYGASDVYLCLSEYEPFGLTILESMYMETPIIATSNGGSRDLIAPNISGLIVHPHDYGKAAYGTYSLLRDQIFRKTIIENAKSYVRTKFTWLSRAREFARFYDKLLLEKPDKSQERFLTHINSFQM